MKNGFQSPGKKITHMRYMFFVGLVEYYKKRVTIQHERHCITFCTSTATALYMCIIRYVLTLAVVYIHEWEICIRLSHTGKYKTEINNTWKQKK